jgi:hypothetical protein
MRHRDMRYKVCANQATRWLHPAAQAYPVALRSDSVNIMLPGRRPAAGESTHRSTPKGSESNPL